MRYLIVITVLLGIGYSQCNESNWQDYYNSEGHNMEGCDLAGANLEGAEIFYNTSFWGASFIGANLEGTDFGSADLTYAYFDENLDLYDDVSYEAGYNTGAESGDLNLDGTDNVLDVVILVDNILNP